MRGVCSDLLLAMLLLVGWAYRCLPLQASKLREPILAQLHDAVHSAVKKQRSMMVNEVSGGDLGSCVAVGVLHGCRFNLQTPSLLSTVYVCCRVTTRQGCVPVATRTFVDSLLGFDNPPGAPVPADTWLPASLAKPLLVGLLWGVTLVFFCICGVCELWVLVWMFNNAQSQDPAPLLASQRKPCPSCTSTIPVASRYE